MPHLLHLDSAATLKNSRSREITAAFADAWRDGGSQYTVTYRDLHRDPLPHLADAVLHWPPRLRPAGAACADPDVLAAAEALQDELVAELLAADVLLVGAPLYNYSVPSSLKAWIDHVHIPARTAPFVDAPEQPLAGRPAVVVSSRGASYDPGSPTEGWDHAVPVLELILGTALGMSVEVITTSLTLAETVTALAPQLDRSRAELAAAREAATAAARRLTTTTTTENLRRPRFRASLSRGPARPIVAEPRSRRVRPPGELLPRLRQNVSYFQLFCTAEKR